MKHLKQFFKGEPGYPGRDGQKGDKGETGKWVLRSCVIKTPNKNTVH